MTAAQFTQELCYWLRAHYKSSVYCLIFMIGLCSPPEVYCADTKPGNGQLFGKLQHYQVPAGSSLIEVARKFDVGFNAIVAANPGIDPWVPAKGSQVVIPSFWILPEMQRTGLVVNIPELRLYYFKDKGIVSTFPLGIGSQGRETPVGKYRVVEKLVRPAWQVPETIRKENRALPPVVPPGPDNPLGSHALRLSGKGLLIHGTNRPWGVGRQSSHGCLRLYPEDIIKLFDLVRRGVSVTIINQPVKACRSNSRIFLEVHRPLSGAVTISQTMHLLADKRLLGQCDFGKIKSVLDEMRGMPIDVTLE